MISCIMEREIAAAPISVSFYRLQWFPDIEPFVSATNTHCLLLYIYHCQGHPIRGFAKKKRKQIRVYYRSGWVGGSISHSELFLENHPRLSAVITKRVRLPQRGRMGLIKLSTRLMIATLNVGSMTGKGR